ncbi:MAG TPA: hypothetical protein VEK76_03150 [Candidatus Binatia bacterium]|nr:hypothetical protein [Candidatus Binatia bacterium]
MRWAERQARAAGALLVLVALAGCGGTATTTLKPSAIPPQAAGLTWLVTAEAVREMSRYGDLSSWLAGDTVLEVVSQGATPVPGFAAQPVVSFRSYQAFSAAVSSGAIPTWARLALLDLEHWTFTPLTEQENPSDYETVFVRLARSHGLTPILAPGLDLTQTLAPGSASPEAAFVALGLPAEAAQALAGGPGYIDLQAQSLEGSSTSYSSFVTEARAQVTSTDPSAVVLAGLSTNPSAGPVDLTELSSDVSATRSLVAGYWLNVPSPGAACPGCGPANPQLGALLLQAEVGHG